MPVLMQPAQRAFHDPAVNSQSTAVRGPASGKDRLRSSGSKLPTVRLRVVGAIGLYPLEPVPRPSAPASDAWNGVDQRKQLGHVMTVRSCQGKGHYRMPIAIDQQVVLGSRLSPIHGIWACFFPPCIARTEAESTTARDQSILSAALSLS